jgi:hypothetical protein
MGLDMEFIRFYNLEFLMNNIYGLYLPILITLIFFIKSDVLKKFLNVELFTLFIFSAFLCTYLSEVLSIIDIRTIQIDTGQKITITGDLEGLYTNNYFPAIYLFWFGLVKKDFNFNVPVIWCGSFLTLWISDIFYAHYEKGEHLFSNNIGGAGLFDGLLVDPAFSTLTVVVLSYLIKATKNRKNKKSITKASSY